MQPLIHGKFFLQALSSDRTDLDAAIGLIHDHFDHLNEVSPAYPPISLGDPELIEKDGILEFSSSDEFWLYEMDSNFWENLARKFSSLTINVYYGSVFIGEKCGTIISENGLVTNKKFEDHSPEAIELSKELNGAGDC